MDLGSGFLRGPLGLRQHGDNRLALPADLIGSEHGLIFRPYLDQRQDRIDIVWHIRGCHNPSHARMLDSLRRIDAENAGMVMRTAHHLQMEKAGNVSIRKEGCTAHDVSECIGARPRLPDLVQIVLALVGEIALSQFHGVPLKPRWQYWHVRR